MKLLLTVCVLALAVVAVAWKPLSRCMLVLALRERRRRKEAVRQCREERKKRRQAERGFRAKIESVDADAWQVEQRLSVMHGWYRKGRAEEQRAKVADEMKHVTAFRGRLQTMLEDGVDAVAIGAVEEGRYTRH